MKRIVLCGLVLLACTKARTSEPPSAGSAPVARAPAEAAQPAASTPVQVQPATPGAPAAKPAPSQSADVEGGVGVVLVPGEDEVVGKRSPAADLTKQLNDRVGSSGTPARGGRSLVVVTNKTALDTTSLSAGRVAYEYVLRGQASVKRCFEELRAKHPAATGLLTLRFAVDATGAVVDAHVDGFDSEVASCVQSAMSTWTFTAPEKRTRFELVLNLVIG